MTAYRRSMLCVVVAAGVAFAACDIGLFGNDRRTIAGPYGLFVAETKFYLILDKWNDNQPCGLLEGSITELGRNDLVILANQETCSGKPSGWMVVNIKTGMIQPPVSAATLKTRPDLNQIQVMPVDKAWDRLRR